MKYTHFVKQPNLKLKTRPKQLLGSLPLSFELPNVVHSVRYITRIVEQLAQLVIIKAVPSITNTPAYYAYYMVGPIAKGEMSSVQKSWRHLISKSFTRILSKS